MKSISNTEQFLLTVRHVVCHERIKMDRVLISTLTLTFWFLLTVEVSSYRSYDFHFDQIYLKNQSYLEGYYNCTQLRISKYNRTAYAMHLNVEFFEDIDDTYSIKFFLGTKRSNSQQVFNVVFSEAKPFSTLLKRYYTIYSSILKRLQSYSNLPPPVSTTEPIVIKKVWSNYSIIISVCLIEVDFLFLGKILD